MKFSTVLLTQLKRLHMPLIFARKSETVFSKLWKYNKSNKFSDFCSDFPIQLVIVFRDLLTFLPFILSCKFDC